MNRNSRWDAFMPKTVVITGASSGIGEALALRYAREGVRLGLFGRNRERLDRVATQCRRLGAAEVHTATIDIRARADIGVWLEEFDRVAPVDVLIANAGVLAGRPPDGEIESPEDSFALIETNVLGVLNSIHPLLPKMISRGYGQIGIVASIAGFIPLPDAPSYCASKSAVLSYGLALRGLLSHAGVGVSVICPGYVTTAMTEQESGWKPFEMPPERAAELIYRGLARNRSIIAFPLLLAVLARLGGAVPDRVRRWALKPLRFTVQAGRAAGPDGM
jgi:short-subunit dehydrogenase